MSRIYLVNVTAQRKGSFQTLATQSGGICSLQLKLSTSAACVIFTKLNLGQGTALFCRTFARRGTGSELLGQPAAWLTATLPPRQRPCLAVHIAAWQLSTDLQCWWPEGRYSNRVSVRSLVRYTGSWLAVQSRAASLRLLCQPCSGGLLLSCCISMSCSKRWQEMHFKRVILALTKRKECLDGYNYWVCVHSDHLDCTLLSC